MPVDFSALDDPDDTLTADGDVPTTKRRPGRPPGAKNKPKKLPTKVSLGATPGPRERAPSQQPFEIYNVPDPLAMAQALYAELAWRIETLRNMRKLGGGVGNRQGLGIEANEAAVPILVDTANTLLKALQAHKGAMDLAERMSKNKSPAELLELAVLKIMGQDLATQRGIIRRLRENLAALAPVSHTDKVQMGEAKGFKSPGAVEGLADLDLGEDDAA